MSDSAGERNGPATDAVRADSRHVAQQPSIAGALCSNACRTPFCGAICTLPEGHLESLAGFGSCACRVHAASAASSPPSTCGLQCDAHSCTSLCVRLPHRGGLDWCGAHYPGKRDRPAVPVTPADFDRMRKDVAATPDLAARVKQLEAELRAAQEAVRARREDLEIVAQEHMQLRREVADLERMPRRVGPLDAELGRRVRAILGNPGCTLHLIAGDRSPTVTIETKWGEFAFEDQDLDDGVQMAEVVAALRAPKHAPAGAR